MIIDIHAHLGWDYTFEIDFTKKQLLDKIENYDVDVQIVQPGATHDLSTAMIQHDVIAELCRSYPGLFFGMANPSPHLSTAEYEEEIRRCVEDLGFVAIKLHPYASAVHPDSKAGRKAFECARKYDIPLMVHTGSGMPFASPTNIINVAGEYADVKVIMAHCGMSLLADEASEAFSRCPNVYGDTSWTKGYLIRRWVRTYGPRMMLASDHAENMGTELAKIKTWGFTEDEKQNILASTAISVFKLENRLIK